MVDGSYITISLFIRRMSQLKQELYTLLKNLNSSTSFCGLRVTQSLIFCVVFCRSLFVFLSPYFWSFVFLSPYFWSFVFLFPYFWSFVFLSPYFWSLYYNSKFGSSGCIVYNALSFVSTFFIGQKPSTNFPIQ